MNPLKLLHFHKLFISILFFTGMVFSGSSQSISQDSTSLDSIYNLFEYTVAFKDANAHLNLYAYSQAPVYIVRKNPTGPTTLGLWNVQSFANSFSNSPDALELQISDEHYHIRGNMAISDAAFDEVVNGNTTASGRDMFGYIRTANGWKLMYLHNTVVMANDTTDYTIPVPLNNTVTQVLDTFQTRFNAQNSSIGHLFINTNNLVLSFSDTLPSSFSHSKNQLNDFLPDFVDATIPENIQLSNIEIIYVDDYLATAFASYEITTQGQLTESGTTWFNFFGNTADDWRISSWVRDVDFSQPLSVHPSKVSSTHMGLMFPNPSNEKVFTKLSSLSNEMIQWQIFDLKGVLISSGNTWINADHVLELNVSNFPDGNYFLSIQDKMNDTTISSKFTVKK